jgi:hypothetical protein
LKDQLRVVLKDFKSSISNEEGIEKAIVQSNEVLAQLKAMRKKRTSENVNVKK